MTASLCRLTCLGDMIQNSVLIVRNGKTGKEIQRTYNLLTSPAGLLDT
jgi:hypothetical protein